MTMRSDLRSIILQDMRNNDFRTAGRNSSGTEYRTPSENPRPYGEWADSRERRKCALRSSWNKKDDSAEREDRRN